MTRRAALIALPVCVAALVAACGPNSPAATPKKTITVTVHPSSPAGQAKPSTASAPASTRTVQPSTPVSATTAPSGPAPCQTRYLGAKTGLSQGAAGSVYVDIVFTNLLNATCTLYGYPGVSLGGGHPVTQIGQAATENPATPRELVTLAPSGEAYATLRIVQAADFPSSSCHPVQATYLQVIPPNQTGTIYVAYRTTACAGSVNLLTVNVVQPGSGG